MALASVILHKNGPDQIKPANGYRTWSSNGTVKIRPPVIADENESDYDEIISIPTQLSRTATKYPRRAALRYALGSATRTVSFREYELNCRIVAKAFLKLGLQRYHAVCILGYNAPEWIYSAVGAILAGGIQVGIYLTSSQEACSYYLAKSEANIIVVEDDVQLQKILPIKDYLPFLKAIVQYKGKPEVEEVYAWDDVIRIGREQPDSVLHSVQKTMAVNECCTVIYTSGTTGQPKGVMLNHANILHGAKAMKDTFFKDETNEFGTLSYLPMNHILAQMTDIYLPLLCGQSIYIADKNCLKDTLIKNLKQCRPDYLIGVPRVWEKLKDELLSVEMNVCRPKRWMIAFAKHVALNRYLYLNNGLDEESFFYKIFKRTIYKKMRKAVGLQQCKQQMTGGAETSQEMIKYFYSLDIPIINGYGISEACDLCTASKVEDFPDQHLGKVQDEVIQIKIFNPDNRGNGEIVLNGRGVFMGYLNDQEKTVSTIDQNGWMYSGDVGALDNKSRLTISGRIKEIIITAGGENIPAPLIENTVKSYLPIVSNAVLVGEKRKYLTILLTLKCQVDSESGIPTERLAEEVVNWCETFDCDYESINGILRDKPQPIYKAIQDEIDRVNKRAFSNAQKIQKFAILPSDFSTETGELGPTLKLKRPVIYEKYAHIINELY